MNNNLIGFFREAAPYIHLHRGKVFVIAFSGEVIEEDSFSLLIQDIATLSALGARIVLVYGARPQVDKQLQLINHKIQLVEDMRVTDDLTLKIAQETIGYLRIKIENKLSHALSKPPIINESLGVLSGNFVTAKPYGIHHGTDYQHTGTVRKINNKLIKQLINAGSIVLISSLGFSPTGETFNLRYEDVASFTAKSIQADKLIFIHADMATPTTDIELQQIDQFIETHPKQKRLLKHIKKAMENGVERVHLISTKTKDGLFLELYTRDGIGTMFNASRYETSRQATIEDVSGIIELIEPLEAKGALIKRSREQLELEIDKFSIIERDGKVIGCAALYDLANTQMGELACLAVHPDYKGGERGDRLLKLIIQKANNRKLNQLLVLTTQSIDWFRERGFKPGEIDDLPDQKKALYNFQRNSKILIKNITSKKT
ncbi:MAG: amino-acid N-acetyltransferase [Sulfurovum sp.]|nr:MAG: amino-acid N-acetyltransferase [Sulfurovum sp.]